MQYSTTMKLNLVNFEKCGGGEASINPDHVVAVETWAETNGTPCTIIRTTSATSDYILTPMPYADVLASLRQPQGFRGRASKKP